MMNDNNEKIRVRFTTKYEQYIVSDTPFAVPLKLGRKGLSDVINHLLELNDDMHISFEVLINDKLLQTSLKKFIDNYRISTENILVIEYFPSTNISNESKSEEFDSWIGCIDSFDNTATTGTYDGNIQLIDFENLNIISTHKAHDESIRDIITFSTYSNDHRIIATASKDSKVKLFNYYNDNSLIHRYTLHGHMNSVESLVHWKNRNIILSGDWNGSLIGWNTESIDNDTSQDNKPIKKKFKNNSQESVNIIRDISPTFTIKAHVQSISDIQISKYDENIVYTCSWDHSIKRWDMERQDCVMSYVGSKVITSLDTSIHNNHILTSHPDGRVRLWDSRTKDDGQCKASFGIKTDYQWISKVKWHVSKDHIFSSIDYAGNIHLWDIRSENPYLSREIHDGKALCMKWIHTDSNESLILSGGSDCRLNKLSVD